MDTPVELLVTRGGSLRPILPAEAPVAACPGEQDLPEATCYAQATGTESGEQTFRGAGSISPLPRTSNHAVDEEKQWSGAEPITGRSMARRDKGDAAAEALGIQQEISPGTRPLDPVRVLTAGGLGRAGAGGQSPPGAEAGSTVLGKQGCFLAPQCGEAVPWVFLLIPGVSLVEHGQSKTCKQPVGLPRAAGVQRVEIRLAVVVEKERTHVAQHGGLFKVTCLPLRLSGIEIIFSLRQRKLLLKNKDTTWHV